RNPRPTASAAGTGGITARIRLRAWWSDVGQELRDAIRALRRACWYGLPDLSAHAAPRLRLCPGQCRPRHAGAAGLARAQEHSAHRALYRAGAESVQGLLAIDGGAALPRNPAAHHGGGFHFARSTGVLVYICN